MKVTFLRHAVSIFNENETSEKDCDLSETGKKQASQITGEFDVVVCSILKRTKQTLEYSQIKYKELFYSELCREFRVDICDYLENEDEIKETKESLDSRAKEFCNYLKSNFRNKNVLVVSHRDFIYHLNGETNVPKNAEIMVIDI